jgi:hypothetical protein
MLYSYHHSTSLFRLNKRTSFEVGFKHEESKEYVKPIKAS